MSGRSPRRQSLVTNPAPPPVLTDVPPTNMLSATYRPDASGRSTWAFYARTGPINGAKPLKTILLRA